MSYCVLVALLVSMATRSYAVGVGGKCDASANCITTNTQSTCVRMWSPASCITGVCYCNTGYTGTNCTAETIIKLHVYGQSCTQNSDCGFGLTCTSSACACAISTYTYMSAIAMCMEPATKLYGESCTQSTDCYNGWLVIDPVPNAMTCSTTCHCAKGYVHRSGYCYIPYLGEACSASIGCTTVPLVPIDASRRNETCINGTCSCPSSTDQYTFAFAAPYPYCLATTTATLKMDGTTCTLHNECASKLCGDCLGDVTRTKRCVRLDTSGISGIQATTVVLLTLVALKVTLI